MNMNKNKILLIILCFILTSLSIKVNAEEVACNRWHTDKNVCITKSYKGYMCEYDGNKKGGSRCYQGDKVAKEVAEKITACEQIKDHDDCVNSKIVGHECIWRQNACYDNTMIDDGTGETIIANDKEDRENQETDNKDHNSDANSKNTLDETIVGEGFCEEDSTRRVLSLVGIILMIAKVLVPLIIILIGSIDLFKAVMSKDEKDLMKSVKSIGLRLLVGIFIFFVPTIVDVVIDLVRDGHNENQCVECVLNPNSCR